jgi:hypothetical protein
MIGAKFRRRERREVEAAPVEPGPWQMPPELERGIPRPVEITWAGRALAAAIGLLVVGGLAAGILLHLSTERERARSARLEREGAPAAGVVIRTGRSSGKDGQHYIVYSYAAAGRDYERRITVRRRDIDRFPVGAPVEARYLPEEPGRSWPLGYEPSGPPLWVALVVPLSLWVMAPVAGRALLWQRSLLEEGRGARAVVLNSKRVHRRHSQHAYRAEYEFQTLSGATRRVRLDSTRQPAPPGSIVTILYDPNNPRKAVAYPVPLYRIAERPGR